MPMDDRVVANELQNGSTQSSLACKLCRKKKLRCDRNIPQCRNCQKISRTCEYPEVAHKPGPRPGTHRRSAKSTHTREGKLKSSTIASKERQLSGTSASSEHQQSPQSVSLNSYTGDVSHSNSLRHTGENGYSPDFNLFSATNSVFSTACESMRMSEQHCSQMIEVYFKNVTTFSLFHQPTFLRKLAAISSAKQMQALLTSMLAFSIRYLKADNASFGHNASPREILDNAYAVTQECITEFEYGPPPLHLLQSLIIQTLLLSSYGVQGKSWRLAGQCIRVAYELRLHELDLDSSDSESSPEPLQGTKVDHWISTEEKRRAWWATFECDVFASTIQRSPNGIDWTRNRTNLPSSDEAWFNGTPARSCYLHVDLNRRWRDLRDSGNTSPIAWFLLLNSYKWDALSATQRIAPPTTYLDDEKHIDGELDESRYPSIFRRKKETIENCLRCAVGAMPEILRPTSFLAFEPSSRGRFSGSSLTQDHGRYLIHIMGQVAQLLLSRKDVRGGDYIAFPADLRSPPPPPPAATSSLDGGTRDPKSDPAAVAIADASAGASAGAKSDHTAGGRRRWQRCLHAADEIASVVRNSSPSHYRYVNPNIATALWMAAATQHVVLAFHRDDIDVDLARSNLDLLTTTIESFIRFWDVPKTLVQSLATLEQQLRSMNARREDAPIPPPPLQPLRPLQSPSPTTENLVMDRGQESTGVGNDRVAGGDVTGLVDGDSSFDLSPFDVLQAMDFGAMYNGVENWENLFLDPGFQSTEFAF